MKTLIPTNHKHLDIYVPEVLRTSKEDWVHQSAFTAVSTALEVASYYFRVAQARWGHNLGSIQEYNARIRRWDRRFRSSRMNYSGQFLCSLTVGRLGEGCVGMAKNDNEIIISPHYLNRVDDQWSVLTETVPHEVAHILFNTLYLYTELLDNTNLFGTKRVPHHGKLWKSLFCGLTGFTKIKNRFYNQVVR